MPDTPANTMIDVATVTHALTVACRAPSLHNSQPWRWVLDGGTLHLLADPDRVIHAADRGGREALISCGVVLDHFQVAMAAAGWTAIVDRLPDPGNPVHLAAIDCVPRGVTGDDDRKRADAILRRRTDRLPFAAAPNWPNVEARLRDSVDSAAVRLTALDDDQRPELARASQLAEALRLYDSTYHAELGWWADPTPLPFAMTDGIPQSALVSAAESDRVDVGRAFPVSRHGERRTAFGEDRSRIVVLTTYDESPDSVLRCGQALSAVLLDATLAGLATCTLTHLTEVAVCRNIVAELTGAGGFPQVLVRIGAVPSPLAADVPPPTPRRPVRDILEIRNLL